MYLREKVGIDDGEDITVMRMLVEDLPQALTIDMLKEVVEKDQDYQLLVHKVRAGHKPDPSSTLQQYRKVWEELSILHGRVMRQDRIVIPQADLGEDIGNLRQWVVELSHEGHVGGPAAKSLLKTEALVSRDGPDGGDKNQHLRWLPAIYSDTPEGPSQTNHCSQDTLPQSRGRSLGPNTRWQIPACGH